MGIKSYSYSSSEYAEHYEARSRTVAGQMFGGGFSDQIVDQARGTPAVFLKDAFSCTIGIPVSK